jgi:hypothetical protein
VIDIRMMAAGMAALGAAFNREISPQVAEVFHGVVGAKLTAEQWERAVRRSLESEMFFPTPAALLRYGLADGSLAAKAGEVVAAIVRSFEQGKPLGPRDVRERFGTAAMEAFVAAGGTRAFEWCEAGNEPFRLKTFRESFVEVAEVDPRMALPTGDEPRQIEAGDRG